MNQQDKQYSAEYLEVAFSMAWNRSNQGKDYQKTVKEIQDEIQYQQLEEMGGLFAMLNSQYAVPLENNEYTEQNLCLAIETGWNSAILGGNPVTIFRDIQAEILSENILAQSIENRVKPINSIDNIHTYIYKEGDIGIFTNFAKATNFNHDYFGDCTPRGGTKMVVRLWKVGLNVLEGLALDSWSNFDKFLFPFDEKMVGYIRLENTQEGSVTYNRPYYRGTINIKANDGLSSLNFISLWQENGKSHVYYSGKIEKTAWKKSFN